MIGQKLSHFRVLDRIGEGGMGVVYRARDENLQRVVALKVLPSDRLADQERRLRFLREARAAASVTHPSIAVVHEVEESDGVIFIAMEFIEGRTLRAVISGRPMPLRELLRLGVEIAEGLSAAHLSRLVHRDLKPDNVMITLDSRVKILDFGLAKMLEERAEPAPGEASRLATISDEMTQAGRVLGTAGYMSPEQIRGQSVDTRSDLFAFGVVMHEMATGAPPFRGATSMDVMSAILNQEPRPVSQANAEVPAELERIIGKCLEKDADERYQDTRDLVVDLRRLKKGTDSGAVTRQATGQEAVRKETRRRRAVTGALLAGIALALVVAGLGAWRLRLGTPKAGPLTQRLILSDEEVTGQPRGSSLSPDGRHLAFTTGEGLFIRELGSGATRGLPLPEGRSGAWFTRWSPDGTHLYVGLGSQSRSSIWIVSVLTGTVHSLGQDVSAGPWPSPDGKLLAFVPPREGHPNGNELWVMDSQGKSPRQVVSLHGEGTIIRAAWAPNSQWLAFMQRSHAESEEQLVIEVSDPMGGQRAVLLSDLRLKAGYGQVSHLCWLPDGRLLYSLSEPPPNANDMNLWGLPLDLATGRAEGEPSRITNGAGAALLVAMAITDGTRVLAYKSTARKDAFAGSLSVDGARLSDVRRLTFRGATDRVEAWSHDGRVILWSERNGTPDLFIQALDSREATGLVVGPEVVSGASMSPDGNAVLYGVRDSEARPTDDWTLMRLDLTDSTTRTLGKIKSSGRLGCPSRAGAPCVLGEFEGREIVFSLFDPGLGKGDEFARLPLRTGGPKWKLSPDGERLALGEWNPSMKPVIRDIAVPGGQVREIVFQGVTGYDSFAFTADGKGLFIRGRPAGGNSRFMRADLEGRTVVLDRDDNEDDLSEDPVPSPDGRYLAFTVSSLSLDLWLIENL